MVSIHIFGMHYLTPNYGNEWLVIYSIYNYTEGNDSSSDLNYSIVKLYGINAQILKANTRIEPGRVYMGTNCKLQTLPENSQPRICC